jgi:probable F420-dependent oxidoreductase
VRRVARAAEELGFADVWVSDHVCHPATQSYPSPFLLDPLLTLGWGAAVTTEVGLGTSVLVLPLHEPVWLAKALASLDVMSEGRLTVAVGVGWSEGEFAALGASFHDRGARANEVIDVLRTCWRDDPASYRGTYYRFHDIRVVPQPARPIPIWVGGGSDAAFRRGVTKGDGFHLIGLTPEQAATHVARLRRDRPEEEFTISLRTGWDPQGMDPDVIRREYDAFSAAGIQHVVSAPWRSSVDDWLRSMELLADLVGLVPR